MAKDKKEKKKPQESEDVEMSKDKKEKKKPQESEDVEMSKDKKEKKKPQESEDVEMSKDKKEKKKPQESEDVEMSDAGVESKPKKSERTEMREIPPEAIAPIAHPLAEKKLAKKLFKTIKKASKARHVKRGVKEVVKGLRKGDKGLVIMAGDISPIDVLSHVPILCEEASVPYCFVSSKEDLGLAGATKRATSCIMIVPTGTKKNKEPSSKEKEAAADYKELYEQLYQECKILDEQIAY